VSLFGFSSGAQQTLDSGRELIGGERQGDERPNPPVRLLGVAAYEQDRNSRELEPDGTSEAQKIDRLGAPPSRRRTSTASAASPGRFPSTYPACLGRQRVGFPDAPSVVGEPLAARVGRVPAISRSAIIALPRGLL
jgi:hypothetical protein